MEFSHIPVLLEQAVDALAVKKNGIYVDGTAGGGGHSSEILSRLTTGQLISIQEVWAESTVFCLTSVFHLISLIQPKGVFPSMRMHLSI